MSYLAFWATFSTDGVFEERFQLGEGLAAIELAPVFLVLRLRAVGLAEVEALRRRSRRLAVADRDVGRLARRDGEGDAAEAGV